MKKETIPESYTFLETTVKIDMDNTLTHHNKISKLEKDLKRRTTDSKKTRNRYDGIAGGQNKQGV